MPAAALFVVPFAASLCFFCALERVLNAFLCLILWEGSRWKGVAAQQVLVCQVTLVCQLLFGVLSGVVSCVFRVLAWWALFFVAFVMLSMVHVTWEEFPVVWTSMVDFYNSDVGPWVGDVIVVPLSILNLILRAVLPLWNSVMWVGQGLVVHGVLPVVVENIGVLLSMALEVVNLCEHFAQSATVFMRPFLVCTDVACLRPEARGLNLLTPMGDLRQIVGHAVSLSRHMCQTLAVPLDVLVYPLMDINLAQGVHNLANALLHLLTVMPHVTVERCKLAGDNSFSLLMCTPDLEPVFSHLVAGVSDMGLMVDNWLNVLFAVVVSTLTGRPIATCDASVDPILPSVVSEALFADRSTVVVGLTGWLYAVTDGLTAVYVGSGTSNLQSSGAWPNPVNVAYGVAAVSYGGIGAVESEGISGQATTVGSLQVLFCGSFYLGRDLSR